jgi:ParB/RepB/Spo0J family partition protein
MVKKHDFIFKELPVDKVELDSAQPRQDFGTDGDGNRLLLSLKEYGLEEPIKVTEVEPGRYVIIDGHRRYKCASKLGWKTIPCRIYQKMDDGEFESRRYEMQNNRRPWRPLERAEALQRIKNYMKFQSNKELGNHVHLSSTVVSNSLQLKNEHRRYLEMMARNELSESYQIEFVRLRQKLRKIKKMEVAEIIDILFKKVKHQVITNSKEFRKLGRVFLRATANEKELEEFLTNPDMTVSELEQKTVQSGFSLLLEKVVEEASHKKTNGIAYSSQEKILIKELRSLFKGI